MRDEGGTLARADLIKLKRHDPEGNPAKRKLKGN
jgi:hypothetical protein